MSAIRRHQPACANFSGWLAGKTHARRRRTAAKALRPSPIINQVLASGTGVIATATATTGVDMYMGIGGAPEGVLAAAALRCIGGQMQSRLLFDGEDAQKERAKRMGITDLNRKYGLLDMARGDVMFAATGVTDGTMLKGVKRWPGGASTHSIVMRSATGTVRWIEAQHNFGLKTEL